MSSVDDWREMLRKRFETGQTLSGLAKAVWARPPIDARGLPAANEHQQGAHPFGPMASFVGSRIDVNARAGSEARDHAGAEALSRVRAWPVLPLQGETFHVARVEEIAGAIRSLLASTLPGIDWWVPQYWDGPFEKYGIVHGSFAAPPNEATGEPMAIELFGEAAGAVRPGSDEWVAAMATWARNGRRPVDEPTGVRLPTTVQIAVATYSNVLYPGIDVPFYA